MMRDLYRMSSRWLYILAVVVFPLLSILFFGSLFREGVPSDMPIAVVDLDQTATSRKIVRNIDITQLSKVAMILPTEAEAMSQMRSGKIYGFVVIPKNLQADIMASRQAVVSYYYHNSLLIPGGLMQSNLTSILHTVSAGITIQKREAMGQEHEAIMARVQPIMLDMHQLFNPTSNYSVYLSTIILPIMMQIFILLITVYSIGVEIKERTSHQWLRLSNKSMFVALTGKLLPYTIIFLILMMFQNFMLYKVIQVPMQTSIGWLTLSSLLFVLAYQAIGIFAIGLLPTLRHALNLTAFYAVLALSLCGFTFPVDAMSPVFQFWAAGFPVRHYMHIFHSQVLAGFELKYALPGYFALLAFLLLPLLTLVRLKSALIFQNFIEEVNSVPAVLRKRSGKLISSPDDRISQSTTTE